MTKQLYFFAIEPGDKDHLAAYYFDYGVVEAEPDEMDALVKADAGTHGLLRVKPVGEAKIDFTEFQAWVGSGHGEAAGTPLCEADRDLVRAYFAKDYPPDQVEREVEQAYARESSGEDGEDDF